MSRQLGAATEVTVVLPVLDGASTIGTQLDALEGQTFAGRWEVVVADNGSTDGTRRVVAGHRLARRVPVRWVDARRSSGVNVARNAGVAAARGGLVVFCDADDRVASGWLDSYARAAVGRDVVAAGPLEVEALNTPRRARWGPSLAAPVELAPGVLAGWGANMALARAAWQRLGGFDETLQRGFDEIDLFTRAAHAGLEFIWVPEARVDYRVPSTWRSYVGKAVAAGRGDQRARARGHDQTRTTIGVRGSLRRLAADGRGAVGAWPIEPAALRRVLHSTGMLVEAVAVAVRRIRPARRRPVSR